MFTSLRRDVFERSNSEEPTSKQQVLKDDVGESSIKCSLMWERCPIRVSVYAGEFDFNL